MNILIVTQYFWPENFKVNDLALEFKKRGHKVTVLTGEPNYPEGKFYSGYSFFRPKRELWNGIEINRIPLIPRGNGKGFYLLLNYISFALSGYFLAPSRLKKQSFDLIFVFQLSPITLAMPAIRIKQKMGIPMYFWVLDLWPETLYALGVVKSKLGKKWVEQFVKWIYSKCDKLLISSYSFKKSLLHHGVQENRIIYLPNWAEDVFTNPTLSSTISDVLEKRFSDLEGNFKIMFAGNIGEAQDIDTVLNAAVLLKDRKNITWLFVGDGRFRVHLEEAINSRGLSETVYLLGRHPIEAMPYFFSKADVMLASLKPDPVFALTVPAKIQTYMASKKPILSMVSGEGNTIVQQAACGLTCESGDYVQLAHNASLMAQYSSQELSDMGENGFAFYSQNFQKDKLIDRLENFLSSELD